MRFDDVIPNITLLLVLAIIAFLGWMIYKVITRPGRQNVQQERLLIETRWATVNWSQDNILPAAAKGAVASSHSALTLGLDDKNAPKRQCGVLVFGEGGSGKTSLLNRLARLDRKPYKTGQFELTRSIAVREVFDGAGGSQWQYFDILIPDYIGQDMGNLFNQMIAAQLPTDPKYWQILIFVVDPHYSDGENPIKPNSVDIDSAHVQKHILAFNHHVMGLIFSRVKMPWLQHVIILINKRDALKKDIADATIVAAFEPLISDVRKRIRAIDNANAALNIPGPELHVIVGSANTGENIHTIERLMFKSAITALPEHEWNKRFVNATAAG